MGTDSAEEQGQAWGSCISEDSSQELGQNIGGFFYFFFF